MKTIYFFPNKIKSHLFTIVPMAPFIPISILNLSSALENPKFNLNHYSFDYTFDYTHYLLYTVTASIVTLYVSQYLSHYGTTKVKGL